MERQLALLEKRPEWRLDDTTKTVGRQGLAAARASLREARRRADADQAAEASRAPGRRSAA